MSAEIRKLLQESEDKIRKTVRETDWLNTFALTNETYRAAANLYIYRQNDERAIIETGEPNFNLFTPWLVKAVEEHPVTQEQFELAKKIMDSFSFIRRLVGTKGFLEEIALRVWEEHPKEVLITRKGDIVMGESDIRHRLLDSNEVLFHGQQIATAVEPERIKRVSFLVDQAQRFDWTPYLGPIPSRG